LRIQILAGSLVYESTNFSSTYQNFVQGYTKLIAGAPKELAVTQSVFNTPTGKGFAILFVWSSPDLVLGQTYLDKVKAFGNVLVDAVSITTLPEVST